MSTSEPVQCPDCGWTGHPSDRRKTSDGQRCPVCAESMELVD